jgi:hypothetical protein
VCVSKYRNVESVWRSLRLRVLAEKEIKVTETISEDIRNVPVLRERVISS